MENKIRKVIISVVSEYWKPYNELEKNIKISLAKKNILADSIFCAGELVNMYIYVHVNSTLYIYNKNSDIRNAFLIKRFGIKEVAFNNGLAVIKGFYHDLNQLPQVTIINMCVIENFPIPRLNLSTGSIAAYIRFYQKASVLYR